MGELDLLRSLPFQLAAASDEAHARAKGQLLRHIRRAPSARRRRLLVPAVSLVAAGAIAAFFGIGNHGGASAAAARVLRNAAMVARHQPATPRLARGQFQYTKSLIAYMSGGKGWQALSPGVREIWLGPTGGFLHERWGKPRFFTGGERGAWIAAGRPQVNPPEDSGKLPPRRPLGLPTDPDALYAEIHDRAVGHGNSTNAEMFSLVADSLRETDASPALRASLYEVAARISGVELVGPTKDRIGRRGVAVAYVDSKIHERHELIFDPGTSALLGEEYVQLAGNPYDYPVGTVTGYATYVVSAVVNRIGEKP
jgi:hypothetical protein